MAQQKETIFGQGQELFREGAKSTELYYIMQGSIELSVLDAKTGQPVVVAQLSDRSVLGTMSFLEGQPRSATAKCISEVKAIVVTQTQREQLLKSIPTWLPVLIKELSNNLRNLNKQFADLSVAHEIAKDRIELNAQAITELEAKEKSLEAQNLLLSREKSAAEKLVIKLQAEIEALKKKIVTP
jgi:CRP/FNR family cyclic AMP-dependent transcriptional regulator